MGLQVDPLRVWFVHGVTLTLLLCVSFLWVRHRWADFAPSRPPGDGAALLPIVGASLAGAALLAAAGADVAAPWEDVKGVLEALAAPATGGWALAGLAVVYLHAEAQGMLGSRGALARVVEALVLVGALALLWAVAQGTLLALTGHAVQWWPRARPALQFAGSVLLAAAAARGGGAAAVLLMALWPVPAVLRAVQMRGLGRLGLGHVPSVPWLCASALLALVAAAGCGTPVEPVHVAVAVVVALLDWM